MAEFNPKDFIFNSEETLNLLQKDEDCIVIGFKTLEIARRLLNHGVLPGMHITKKQISPLGSAGAYEIEGQLIALRDEEAASVNINYVF